MTLFSGFVLAAIALFCISTTSALPSGHSISKRSASDIPLNGLQAPDGLTLKYIALGYGTQNYTCPNTTTSPVAVGARAVLYDATELLTNLPFSIPALPALAYSVGSPLDLPTLGHHWFSVSSVPTFDLEAAIPRAFLSAKKVGSETAPSCSVPNSVPWLYLYDDGRGVSDNLKAVYRVETAGGAAPDTCTRVGDIEVKYAAEYWFFD